jgi:hypothetical protein
MTKSFRLSEGSNSSVMLSPLIIPSNAIAMQPVRKAKIEKRCCKLLVGGRISHGMTTPPYSELLLNVV